MNGFDAVQQVADALLFEGYVLYPYRASDGKNRVRWQFGVLMPPDYCLVDPSERGWSQTECLLDGDQAVLTVRIRFLQAQRRTVLDADEVEVASLETADATYLPWDEAVVRTVDLRADLTELPQQVPFRIAWRHRDRGRRYGRLPPPDPAAAHRDRCLKHQASARPVRRRAAADPGREHHAGQRLGACRSAAAGPDRPPRPGSRRRGAASSRCWNHPSGPPAYAAGCDNVGVYPVLAGDLLLSSPIILYDHPRIAPESQGDLFDATEIDEILSLRAMTLTEDEKREVRGTDQRAADAAGRVDSMPPEIVDRLHGTIRYLRKVTEPEPAPADAPWWDPGNDTLGLTGDGHGHGRQRRCRQRIAGPAAARRYGGPTRRTCSSRTASARSSRYCPTSTARRMSRSRWTARRARCSARTAATSTSARTRLEPLVSAG